MSEPAPTEEWERFLKAAVHIRGHPLFDARERDLKLEIARLVRDLIEKAEHGEGIRADVEALIESLCDPRWPSILPIHTPWLLHWARADEASLRGAIAGFSERGVDPFNRFARFAEAAEQPGAAAPTGGKPVMLFGSLLNFALEPQALPIVRRGPFASLARRLGRVPPRLDVPVADRYRYYVAFARELERELKGAAIDVRDMLDVQGLIFRSHELFLDPITSAEGGSPEDLEREQLLWAPQPQAGHGRKAPADDSREAGARHTPYLSIGSCLGYERPYLLEWIEFHRLVGVERFFLYNNGDRDAHRELLAPYIEQGTVVLHEWPQFPPQLSAANHCVTHHRHDSRWIAFVDTDEFLFSPTGRPVPEVLVDYEGWPGVGVNWVQFGPSGRRTRPAGLVVESYVRWISQPLRKQVKSIADPTRALYCPGPHVFVYDHGHAVDENHYPISADSTVYLSTARLQLNHYFTRSEEEFRAKEETMHPSVGGSRPPTDFERILWEEQHCSREDTTILRYLPALRENLEAAGVRR